MKLYFLFACLLFSSLQSEDILVKNKKIKNESIASMKEHLIDDLDDLLRISTHSIKQLSNLIDDIATDVKQLAGQASGQLACADKKGLEAYRQKMSKIKATLQELEQLSL